MGVIDRNGDRRGGRLLIRADDPSLTPFAGLAVSGELARSLRLVELVDAEIAAEGRVAPFKRRRRGVTPGELVVSLAESQMVGGDCFDDIEVLRADRAGTRLRAVAGVPSAPCARQLAARFARCQIQAGERALARAGEALDRQVGRDLGEPATIDLDATRITVYGPGKQGARRTRSGELAYAPHIATWAQRGRALTGELVGGNQEKLSGARGATIARRAIRLLGAGHGPVDFRIDSAYYQIELLARAAQGQGALHGVGAAQPGDVADRGPDPRGRVERRDRHARRADRRDDLQARRLDTRAAAADRAPRGVLRRAGRQRQRARPAAQDDPARAAAARARRSGHHGPRVQLHPQRPSRPAAPPPGSSIITAIARRSRSASRTPSSAKRYATCRAATWPPTAPGCAACCALNLTAMTCDICPAAAISSQMPEHAPLRRHAKALRHMLFCVPARIARTARRTILHLPEGFLHADVFTATYDAALALPAHSARPPPKTSNPPRRPASRPRNQLASPSTRPNGPTRTVSPPPTRSQAAINGDVAGPHPAALLTDLGLTGGDPLRPPPEGPPSLTESDARRLASASIWSMRPDGSDQRQVTRLVSGRSDVPESFSPNGATLALTRTAFVEIDEHGRRREHRRGLGHAARRVGRAPPGRPQLGSRLLARRAPDRLRQRPRRERRAELRRPDLLRQRALRHGRSRLARTAPDTDQAPQRAPAFVAAQRQSDRLPARQGPRQRRGHRVMQANADGRCARPILADASLNIWYAAPAWRPGQPRTGDKALRC